jgi:hypothetical protein
MSFMRKYILPHFHCLKSIAENYHTMILLFFLFTGNLLTAQSSTKISKKIVAGQPEKSLLTYQIIKGPENTFGYDIYDQSRLMIHQPSVPGLPGNKGFAKKTDAEKIAGMVINKINHHIMPPTVTEKEMDSLHIKR